MTPRPDPATWRKDVHHFSPGLDAATAKDWCCPGCDRSKFQTVQWVDPKMVDWFDRSQARAMNFPGGFRLSLVRHHDHAASPTRIIDGRFPVTIICSDCNSVDGKVKRVFPDLAKRPWSFSPQEIRRVVQARPHLPHRINYDLAASIADRILFEQWRGATIPRPRRRGPTIEPR